MQRLGAGISCRIRPSSLIWPARLSAVVCVCVGVSECECARVHIHVHGSTRVKKKLGFETMQSS